MLFVFAKKGYGKLFRFFSASETILPSFIAAPDNGLMKVNSH